MGEGAAERRPYLGDASERVDPNFDFGVCACMFSSDRYRISLRDGPDLRTEAAATALAAQAWVEAFETRRGVNGSVSISRDGRSLTPKQFKADLDAERRDVRR